MTVGRWLDFAMSEIDRLEENVRRLNIRVHAVEQEQDYPGILEIPRPDLGLLPRPDPVPRGPPPSSNPSEPCAQTAMPNANPKAPQTAMPKARPKPMAKAPAKPLTWKKDKCDTGGAMKAKGQKAMKAMKASKAMKAPKAMKTVKTGATKAKKAMKGGNEGAQ